MPAASLQCDLCLGSAMERYRGPAPSWRDLLLCVNCGLVIAGGPPPESPGRETPDRGRPVLDARRAAMVMRLVPRGKVLELGCGPGDLLVQLDPSCHEAVGLEPSEDLAREAAERMKGAGIRGDVLAGWLPGAKLPNETFDIAVMVGRLDRCASPRALLMEASRLLRDGGYAFIELPCLHSFTARLRGARWRPLNDPSAGYFFSEETLRNLAIKCGLGKGRTHRPVLGGWPRPGTLVYVARKSSVSLEMPDLGKLVGETGRMTPMGATD